MRTPHRAEVVAITGQRGEVSGYGNNFYGLSLAFNHYRRKLFAGKVCSSLLI